MKKYLFLLRQPVDRISPSLFILDETEGDVVLLEGAELPASGPSGKASYYSIDHKEVIGVQSLTYDELVEKIFSADPVIVI